MNSTQKRNLLVSLPMVAYNFWYSTFTLQKLWQWYICPIFKVEQITFGMAFLLSGLFGMWLQYQPFQAYEKDKDLNHLPKLALLRIATLSLVLIIGYIFS